MENRKMQSTTFWKFLESHKIEIPIIQRDYAQGRIGKEKLREKILKDLKRALDEKLANADCKPLKLDFVYGSSGEASFNPLDGQQRLTTLWLLHWYIAWKADQLTPENKKNFQNFSYETRISSREFCKKLAEYDIKSEKTLVEYLQNQTWFFSPWKQDPTIQAMLHMLGGTPIMDSKNIDIPDGIEEVFGKCSDSEYCEYWKLLTHENCPIVFYYLDLENLSLSDDLYIKMNARGKPLTSFENFKADLVGHIKNNNWEEIWKEDRIEKRLINEGKENLDEIKRSEGNLDKTIAHKLDTTWTNIFWKAKSNDNKIDEIYFAFLNRYFLNQLIVITDEVKKEYLYSAEEIEKDKTFKYLYSEIEYTTYDFYTPTKEEKQIFQIEVYSKLAKILDNFHDSLNIVSKEYLNKLIQPSWDINSKFYFIPEYINNPKTSGNNDEPKLVATPLTQVQRVVFHAICCYFEKGSYTETSFKQWMRVVWNIVENANINSLRSMVGAMRLIDELKPNADNIYNYLASDPKLKSDAAKEQVAEEIQKAKQIINDESKIWEGMIIEAERTSFFKGAIRFLFRTDVNIYNWTVFDNRFKKSQLYFKNGVTNNYKEDAKLLRFLISCFTNWNQFYPWEKFKISFFYDNEILNWKTILTHVAYVDPISQLFNRDVLNFDFSNFVSPLTEKMKVFHEDLVRTPLLGKIVAGCTFNWWKNEMYSLYPYNTKTQFKIFVLADSRNEILSKLDLENIVQIDAWQKIDGVPFLRGWEINFTLNANNKKYKWRNNLQEQNENGEWINVPGVNLSNLENYLKALGKNVLSPNYDEIIAN